MHLILFQVIDSHGITISLLTVSVSPCSTKYASVENNTTFKLLNTFNCVGTEYGSFHLQLKNN